MLVGWWWRGILDDDPSEWEPEPVKSANGRRREGSLSFARSLGGRRKLKMRLAVGVLLAALLTSCGIAWPDGSVPAEPKRDKATTTVPGEIIENKVVKRKPESSPSSG
jgi:hypothetical protein